MTSTDIPFDGRIRPYVPDPDTVRVGDSVRFYEERTELDPIQFEVVRHKLLQINDDHGKTIERLSGSPITLYTNDFNSGLLTAQGEILYMGPYVQWFAAMMDTVIRWILEHRSDSPGIAPGDMWLVNDPYVGTLHQQDVGVLAPIFTDDGRLLCWTGNFAHHYDVGGTVAGSFVPNATDMFDEGPPIPPIKIVEGGKVRADVEELFLRQSRRPDIVRIDLHAQIAGNESAIRKVGELVSRYGEAAIASVMDRVVDTGEKAFAAKLAEIPDGQWSARVFLDGSTEGDRGVYEIVSTVVKHDDHLEFLNEGSHPQVGILNSSYATWRGAIATVLNATMAAEQLYAIGGAMRRVRLTPTPETVTCASFPAAMSCAGNIGAHASVLAAHLAIGKMLGASDTLRENLLCQQAGSQWPLTALSGIDETGTPFGTGLMDGMIGGLGAFSFRDGVDTGGLYFIPRGRAGNVEENEEHFPILYLTRRAKPGSGGAGRFRGGNGLESMFIVHGTSEITQTTATSGVGVPTGLGLFGGLPSCTNYFALVRDSNVLEQFAGGRVPLGVDELGGTVEPLASKCAGYRQGPSDVYVMHGTAGAGYGDPLTRRGESVVEDVAAGTIDTTIARELYGAVLADDGTLDDDGTTALRDELRRGRLTRAAAPALASTGQTAQAEAGLGASHGAADVDGTTSYVCLECEHVLGPVTESLGSYCATEDVDVTTVNAHIGAPSLWVDPAVTLRCLYCPSCGVMMDNRLEVEGREPWDEDRLGAATLLRSASVA